MDNFSGDTEVPIKGSTQKVTKETAGIEEDGFLSVLDLEHSKLPDTFSIGKSLQSGLELLRKETSDRKVEIGGVLFKEFNNEVKIHRINPTAESSDSLVGFNFYSVSEGNIEDILEMSKYYAEHPEKDFFKTRVYFVDSALTQKYRYFFEKLVQDGTGVVVDGKPLARIHSHPSGNMPSSGDFDHVLVSSEDGKQIPEVVLTEDWVYFLVPTIGTPDLSVDSSEKYKRRPNGWVLNEEEEDRIVDHLLTTSKKEKSEEHRNKALNAVRLKAITDKCLKYSVGFYSLAKGESVARRVV